MQNRNKYFSNSSIEFKIQTFPEILFGLRHYCCIKYLLRTAAAPLCSGEAGCGSESSGQCRGITWLSLHCALLK